MRNLFKLKISAKIIVGFSLVIVFSVIIGAISYFSLSTVNNEIETMYHNNLLPLTYLEEARSDLLTIRGDVFKYVYASNAAANGDMEKNMEGNFKALKETMKKYLESGLSEEEKKIASNFNKYIAGYESGVLSALSEHMAGNMAAAEMTVNNTATDRENSIMILNKLVKMSVISAADKDALAYDIYKKSTTMILLLLIASIILSILVTIIVTRSIKKPISKTLKLANSIAEGDLTSRIDHKSNDEIGELINSLNATAGSLQNVIREVLSSSSAVTSASQQLSATMEETNSSMQEVANGISHIAESNESNTAAIEQISATINDISEKAMATAESSKLAAETGREVKASAEKGGELVLNVSDSINSVKTASIEVSNIMLELEKSAHEINQAVELITSISEQTNLLSLNAAIEAARAGEQGRGFAVVANEVRTLAEQSKDATKRIEQMVHAIQSNCTAARERTSNSEKLIKNSYAAASETSSYIMNIIEKISSIVTQINEIADTAILQSQMTKEVSASVDSMAENVEMQASSSEQISATTQQQASSVQEVGATAEELASMAESLNNTVSKFKV